MLVEIEGQAFTGFTELQVSGGFLNNSREAHIHASPNSLVASSYPLKVQSNIVIKVEGQTFLTGYIEQVETVNEVGSQQVIALARDYTADLIDSTIDKTIVTQFSGNFTLKQLCEKVIAGLGITEIKVIQNATPEPFDNGFIAPLIGETAMDFLMRYARRSQVYLNTDGLGNLVIDKGGTEKLGFSIIAGQNDPNSNIISSRSKISISKRFRTYRCYAQQAQIDLNFNTFGADDALEANNLLTSVLQSAEDTEIRRSSRVYNFISDAPLTNAITKNRALWEANYRRSQGTTYNCKMLGHTYNGTDIWPINKIINVVDELADIDTAYLIDSVTFSESVTEGLTTYLNLVLPNSYQVAIEGGARQELQREQQQLKYKFDF